MSTVLAKIHAAAESGERLNWRQLREDIHDEHERATTPEEREQLLAVFTTLMDLVEQTDIAPTDLAQFRAARQKDYNLFVVRECLVGENICTETLDQVTRREVGAGRMPPEHELRAAAVAGMAAPHHSRAELLAMASRVSAAAPQASRGVRGLLARLTGR